LADTVGVSSLLGPDSSNFSHHIGSRIDWTIASIEAIKRRNKLLDINNLKSKIVPKQLKDGTVIKTQPFKNCPWCW
jgi:hypothetical protein